ncbi:hypothetical protein [Streptomyces longisporoflavus]|uniref:Uncharacterized protein n=1 Tax=Streptomyces longisporoflavus TaxID=28044 RepID=A0ABW7QEX5_9ACTN
MEKNLELDSQHVFAWPLHLDAGQKRQFPTELGAALVSSPDESTLTNAVNAVVETWKTIAERQREET